MTAEAVRALYVGALYLYCYTEAEAHELEVLLACAVVANAALASDQAIAYEATKRFAAEEHEEFNDLWYSSPEKMDLGTHMLKQLNIKMSTGLFPEGAP